MVLDYQIGPVSTGTLLNFTFMSEGSIDHMINGGIDATGDARCDVNNVRGSSRLPEPFDLHEHTQGGFYALYMLSPGETSMRYTSWFSNEQSNILEVSVSKSTFSCSATAVKSTNPHCQMIDYSTPNVAELLESGSATTSTVLESYLEAYSPECVNRVLKPQICVSQYRKCDSDGIPLKMCPFECMTQADIDAYRALHDSICSGYRTDVCLC